MATSVIAFAVTRDAPTGARCDGVRMRPRPLPNVVSKPPAYHIELRAIAFATFADDTFPVFEFRSERRTPGA